MTASPTDVAPSRFSYWRGYPLRYRERLQVEGKRAAVSVLLLVVLPGGGALAWFLGSAWAPLRIIVGLILLAMAGFGAFWCGRIVAALVFARVVPYFEKSLGDGPPLASGAELAKHSQRLDELAVLADATPLSSFGFNDDLAGEAVTWHEPALALATVRALSAKLSDAESALKRDLEQLAEALNRAAARRIRFALLLRTSYGLTGDEKAKRRGSLA